MKNIFKQVLDFGKKSFGISVLPTGISFSNNPQAYKNWVYLCVDKIADTVARTEIRLYKYHGKEKEIEKHEVLETMYRPNKHQTWQDFMYAIVVWLEMNGNAYIHVGKKKELSLLPADRVFPEWNQSKTQILKYKFYRGGTEVSYDEKDIVHIKYPNPYNTFFGKGTLERISDWIKIDELNLQLQKKIFKKGTVINGVIETEITDPQKLKGVQESWARGYEGVESEGGTPILSKGMKYIPNQSSPKDLLLTDFQKENVDRIVKAFGLSMTALGEVDGTGRANAEMADYIFKSQTILPKLERIINYLNVFLLPKLTRDNVYLGFISPVPRDKEFELNEKKVSLAGKAWRTPNEVREMEGRDALEEGNELGKGGTSIDLSAFKKAPYHVKVKSLKEADQKKKSDDVVDKLTEKLSEKLLAKRHKEYVERVEVEQKAMAKEILKHERKTFDQVKENLRKYEEKAFKDYFDIKKYTDELVLIVSPFLLKIMKKEGEVSFARVSDGSFNDTDLDMINAVKRVGERRGELYADTTAKKLEKEIGKGRELGESLEKLEKRIDEVAKDYSVWRAGRLAQDLSFATANTAIEHAYIQSGVVKAKEWYTAEDERVCLHCNAMHGKVMELGKNFLNVGDSIGELDISLEVVSGNLHPGCRCTILPVIK